MPGWGDVVEQVRAGKVKEEDLWSRLSDSERAAYLSASKSMGWDAAGLSPQDNAMDVLGPASIAAGVPGVMRGIGAAKASLPAAGSIAGGVTQAGKQFAQAHPMVTGGLGMLASRLLPPGIMRDMGEMWSIMHGMGGSPAGAATGATDEELLAEMRAKGNKMAPPTEPMQGPRLEDGSFGRPVRRADPPNLFRQGNVTTPGPGGTGSPSVPSAQPDSSFDRYPIPSTPGNAHPNSPLQSLATGDEVDKRRVMFGGADGGPEFVSPDKKTPVGRRKPK